MDASVHPSLLGKAQATPPHSIQRSRRSIGGKPRSTRNDWDVKRDLVKIRSAGRTRAATDSLRNCEASGFCSTTDSAAGLSRICAGSVTVGEEGSSVWSQSDR